MTRLARRLVAIAALTLALLGSGCDEDPSNTDGGNGPLDKPHSSGGSSWTVLVYMVADNDLEPFAIADLQEMMRAGSASGFNLIVQADRADGYSSDGVGGLPDFTGVKRLKVNAGSLEELADLGELDSADPATLASFVTWGLSKYPADRTALVFWDHGGGWHGFGLDEASGNRLMHLPEIEQGVRQGLAGANAKPFALIGFDACLMATWEVALTLAPHAEYLLASEETEPGHGWDWEVFSIAAGNPSTEPVALARRVIDGFLAQAQAQGTADNVTLSLVDLYRLGSVSTAIGEMTKTFDGTPALVTAFGRGQERALKFGDAPDPSRATNLVDLATLAEETSKEASQVSATRGAVLTAISGAVVAHVEGAAKATAKGLAVYFPPSAAVYDSGYDALPAAASWRSFLHAYFGGANAETAVPTFTNPNKLAVTAFDGNGHLTVDGTLDSSGASSVTKATVLEGLVVNGTYVLLSEEPAAVNGTSVHGSWDLSVLQITRGSEKGFGYAAFDTSMSNRVELDVLFAYRKTAGVDPQTCIRQMIFDTSTGTATVTSDSYFVANNGAFGELSPTAGSTLMPLVKSIDSNTGNLNLVEGSSTAFAATVTNGKATFDDLKLEFVKVNPQVDVVVVMTAENAAGKGDAVLATEKTP